MYYYAKKDKSEWSVTYEQLCKKLDMPDMLITTTEIKDWVAYTGKDAPSDLAWYQYAVEVYPVDGAMTWEVRDVSEAEKNKIEEEQRVLAPIVNRKRRDRLLQTTVDTLNPMRWETLSESKKQEWRVYRQALLDVPQQPEFPTDIVWPTTPE